MKPTTCIMNDHIQNASDNRTWTVQYVSKLIGKLIKIFIKQDKKRSCIIKFVYILTGFYQDHFLYSYILPFKKEIYNETVSSHYFTYKEVMLSTNNFSEFHKLHVWDLLFLVLLTV